MQTWYLKSFIRLAQSPEYLISKGVLPEVAGELAAFLGTIDKKDTKWFLKKIEPGKTMDEYKAVYEKFKEKGKVVTDIVELKMKELNIQSPSCKMFLMKYGKKLVNWGDDALDTRPIANEKDLNEYIATRLIPEVVRRGESSYPDNNFVKDIDSERLERLFKFAMDEPIVQQASEFKISDPARAKRMILDGINQTKEEAFSKWVKFLTYGYQHHGRMIRFSHPEDAAFVFMMMNQVFDASPATKYQVTNMFPPSVEGNYQIVQDTPENQMSNANLITSYKKYFFETNCQNLEPIPETEYGWLPIASQATDRENLQKNADRLSMFAIGHGWCFGNLGTAESYLGRQGQDFYLLLHGDDPVVAMAYSRIGSKVTQIKGKNNAVPVAFAYQVRDLLRAKGLNAEDTYEWQNMKQVFKLADELKDPKERDKYFKAIEKNFTLFTVMPEQYKAMPEAIAAAIVGYGYMLSLNKNTAPDNLVPAPPEIANDPKVIESLKEYYLEWISTLDAGKKAPPKVEDLPVFVRDDPRLQQALIKPYLNWITREPEAIFDCPDFIIDFPEAKKAYDVGIIKWKDKILTSPNPTDLWEKDIPEHVPQQVRMLPQIQAAYRVATRRQQLNQGELQAKDVNPIEDEIFMSKEIIRQIDLNPNYFKEKLNSQQQLNPDYRIAWLESTARNLEMVDERHFGPINPETGQPISAGELDGHPRIQEAKINGWIKLLERTKGFPDRQRRLFSRCPQEFKSRIQAKNLPSLKGLFPTTTKQTP